MRPGRTGRGWLVPFYANTFLVQVLTFVLRPTTVYRAIELDVPAQWLGALGASFALLPLLLAVVSGQATDRFGERRVMVTGAVLTLAASVVLVVLGRSVWGLLLGSVVLGVGHLCSVVAQQALVANRTPRARFDSAFGHYTFAASGGQAIGPGLIVLFGGAASIPDTNAIFTAAVAVGAALVLSALVVPAAQPARAVHEAARGSMRDLLRRPGLARALTVSCVVLAAVDISLVYLPVLGTERGIAAGTIGVLLTVRAAASMASRFFLGSLADRWGRRRLYTGSIAVSAVAVALVPVPMPVWVLCLVVAGAGLGLGAGQPLTMSWLAAATPPGLRGRAMALRLTGNRLGQVVVPSAAGLVAVGAGAGGVLWMTAAALTAVGFASRGLISPRPPL